MNKNTKLRSCWIWNESVTDFVSQRIKGHTLNCPCGDSSLGDVLCDIDPIRDYVKKVDMRELPFDDNTFDTVIQDPPWKIGYFQRMRPFFECVRVVKVGGRILYNAYWIPQSKFAELKEVYVRQDGQFTNASIISVFEKIKDIN
jgi:hypothetical protein